MEHQPNFVLVMAPLVLFTVIFVLVYAYKRSARELPEEQGRTPIFKRQVGGRIGMIRYRGPFVAMRFYDDFLVVGSFRTYRVDYDPRHFSFSSIFKNLVITVSGYPRMLLGVDRETKAWLRKKCESYATSHGIPLETMKI